MTKPPGHPACRMLSHFVLSFVNIVATTGLMKASTVPLPKARTSPPQYNKLAPAAGLSVAILRPIIPIIAQMIWQAAANIIENLYPTLSIIKLNRMMLIAKGHIWMPLNLPT